jgi:PAS domain-containing protein
MGRCVHTDITERKQQQQILAESEYRYHNIIYSLLYDCHFKGRRYDYRNCKRCYYQNLGKGKNIIGKSLFTVMPEIIEQGFAGNLS